MKDKLILTDCDGVILDWEYAFDSWMRRHGYSIKQHFCYSMEIKYGLGSQETKRLVRMFNESASIRKLPPLRDAIKYVRKLHENHGYVFRVISSLSNDYYAQHLRTKNLIEMFGPSVFESFTYLDTGADKDEALAPYEGGGCWWIEDKPENAVLGISLGLESVIVDHHHNVDAFTIARVKNWKEIYELIAG